MATEGMLFSLVFTDLDSGHLTEIQIQIAASENFVKP
jgi:hypothetical protein